MKLLKFTGLSVIAITATVLTLSNAYAASKMDRLNKTFKVAIIKDTAGTEGFATGHYKDAIDSITASRIKGNDTFKNLMALCVAHMKLKELSTAKENCNGAIELITNIGNSSKRSVYLTSIAYSNRAIVNYLNGDNSAAAMDFSKALLLDDNKTVRYNVELLADKVQGETTLLAKHSNNSSIALND